MLDTQQEMQNYKDAANIVSEVRIHEVARTEPHIIWAKLDRVERYIRSQFNKLGEELYADALA